jgi:arylsulfatase
VANSLLGKTQKKHEFLYWEFYNPFQQAVRMGNWKGIRLGTEEEIYLFDLSNDLQELNNVAEKHPEIVKEMESIMKNESIPSPYWPALKKTSDRTRKQFFVDN